MDWVEHYKVIKNRIRYDAPMQAGKMLSRPINSVPIERVAVKWVPEYMPEASPETHDKILCRGLFPARLRPLLLPILRKHNVMFEDIASESRKAKFNIARFEMYYILRESGMSLNQIKQVFNRDHTTVLHGIKRWKEISGV
ncbi:Chromosomal replication initiator, DnaA C-terminal [uncultured Caudovirales phage]|uniref:Chromosomal replication initiator, DnaA C-terminal n=1 Tax=uncultured Caudovirales phage TaxID=2100421 RepID=A0A6J7WFG8_9CAUD|nr:Chromosomal replication initiator, DnaA C-terminal [uncultured Caudovirales phage]